MSRAARAQLVICAALIGYAILYAVPPFSRLPNLLYDAPARRFLLGNRPVPVQLGYFGQLLYGAAGALGFGVVTYAVTARREREPSPSTQALFAAWALTFFTLVGVYFTWQNWP